MSHTEVAYSRTHGYARGTIHNKDFLDSFDHRKVSGCHLDCGDEELRPVGVGTGIGHGEVAWTHMPVTRGIRQFASVLL